MMSIDSLIDSAGSMGPASAAHLPPTKLADLVVPLKHFDDEGPLGFRLRLAIANHLGPSDIYGAKASLFEDPRQSWAASGRSLKPGASEWAVFKHVEHALHENRRVCPRCLDEKGYSRAAWELATVDACSIHQVSLVDECPDCLKPLRWASGHLYFCQCGQDLRQIEAAACGRASALLAAAFEAATCGSHDGPIPVVAHLNLDQLGRLVYYLGNYLQPNSVGRHGTGKTTSKRWVEAWRSSSIAAEVLTRWPEALHEVFRRQLNDAKEDASSGLASTLGAFYKVMKAHLRGSQFTFLWDALESFIALEFDGALTYKSKLLRAELARELKWIPFTAACSLYEVSRRSLTRAMATGIVRSKQISPSPTRTYTFVLRKDVRRLKRFPMPVSLKGVAEKLGLTTQRTRELVPFLFKSAKPPESSGHSWSVDNLELEPVLKYLSQRPTLKALRKNQVVMADVLRAHKLTSRELAELITFGLGSRAFFVGSLEKVKGLPGLVLETEKLRAFRQRFSEESSRGLSLPSAAEYLGIKQEVMYHLANKTSIFSFDPAESTRRIPKRELSAFHADYVWARDLAKTFRTTSRALAQKLALAGVEPVVGPVADGCRQILYLRAQVDAALQRSTLFAVPPT